QPGPHEVRPRSFAICCPMKPAAKRALLGVCFFGLMLGPAAYQRLALHGAGTGPLPDSDAIERYGFSLRESAAEAGIRFVHARPRIDTNLQNIEPQIASMGASVAVVDFDRDGWYDLYVTSSAPGSMNALYRNL